MEIEYIKKEAACTFSTRTMIVDCGGNECSVTLWEIKSTVNTVVL